MKIISTYKVTYQNGMSQIKNLIEHEDFLNDIKPTDVQIDALESKKKFKETNYLKKQLKEKYGQFWFTNKSPMYYAIENNVLELYNGKSISVIMEKLKI